MSMRLVQDLHAGISRRDWSAVETAANRLRDEVELTIAILAGAGIGSLPNDYPLSKLAGGQKPREARRDNLEHVADEAAIKLFDEAVHRATPHPSDNLQSGEQP